MGNPFKKVVRYERQPAVEGGQYDARFRKMEDAQKKAYMSEEKEDSLRYVFESEKKFKRDDGKVTPQRFSKNCSLSFGPRADLRKMAIAIMGGTAKKELFDEGNEDKLWAEIESHYGELYTLDISLSEDGEWNNIESVVRSTKQVPEKTAPKKKIVTAVSEDDDEAPPPDDDDLPNF